MFLLLLLSLFLLLLIIIDAVVNFFVYHSLWIVPSYTGDMIDSFGRLLYRYQTSLLHALKEFRQLKKTSDKEFKSAFCLRPLKQANEGKRAGSFPLGTG